MARRRAGMASPGKDASSFGRVYPFHARVGGLGSFGAVAEGVTATAQQIAHEAVRIGLLSQRLNPDPGKAVRIDQDRYGKVLTFAWDWIAKASGWMSNGKFFQILPDGKAQAEMLVTDELRSAGYYTGAEPAPSVIAPAPIPIPRPERPEAPALRPTAPPAPSPAGPKKKRQANVPSIVDQWLTALKMPKYPGSVSVRTWDFIVQGAGEQIVKTEYDVPHVWRAIYIDKIIPQSVLIDAKNQVKADLAGRGYTKARATQESVFEPAAGILPTTAQEYPYASVTELLRAAFHHAMVKAKLEEGKAHNLRADTECVKMYGLLSAFIRQAKGASGNQKRLALQQISSSAPRGGEYIPLHKFLAERRILCLKPVSPEQVVNTGYQRQPAALVEAFNVHGFRMRATLNYIYPLPRATAIPASQYDNIANTALVRAKHKWSNISKGLRTREVSGDSEWRKLIQEGLTKLNIYRGSLPGQIAQGWEALSAEATKKVLAVFIRDYLDSYGVPQEPGSLSSRLYYDAIGYHGTQKAYNVLATVKGMPGLSPPNYTNSEIMSANVSQIRARGDTPARCLNRVERKACNRARNMVKRYAPTVIKQMGYTRGSPGQTQIFIPAQVTAPAEPAPPARRAAPQVVRRPEPARPVVSFSESVDNIFTMMGMPRIFPRTMGLRSREWDFLVSTIQQETGATKAQAEREIGRRNIKKVS